jgi:hypothetical protein
LEATLDLLVHNGFCDVEGLHTCRLFFSFLDGHVLTELQELVDNPAQTDGLLRFGLHRLPIREFPILRRLAPALATYDGDAEFERGPAIVLCGIQEQRAPSAP